MKYTALGRTGLQVSVIGFGGIPIQRGSAAQAREAILRAEELGINYMDTAVGYTVSEDYIGQALAGRAHQWILATKSMARTREAMAADIGGSLSRLRTDHIHLYQCHNIRTGAELEAVLAPEGAMTALKEAQKAGKVGHIGVTTHSLDFLMTLITCGHFDTVMYPYNVIENQGEAAFAEAAARGVAVIAMKPLAGGSLEMPEAALKAVLENPHVTCAIPGMATPQEVEINAGAASGPALTAEEREALRAEAAALGAQFCRRCGYCMPCPQGIDIPTQFLLEGYALRYGLQGWAQTRYQAGKATAADCTGCRACEPKCPYHLPVAEKMKTVSALLGQAKT